MAGADERTAFTGEKGVRIIETASRLRRMATALLTLCLLIPLTMGCHHREESGIPLPEGKVVFDRIAVVPFQQVAPEDGHAGAVRCPLCGMTFNAAGAPGNPEQVLERLFLEQLDKERPKFTVIAGERVAGIHRRVSAASLTASHREALRTVGGELAVEGVVSGYLYRWRERKGESYAVEKPASVAFEVHLLRVSDGALVWRGTFDRTQSSLMENLLQAGSFFRGKGKWLTAEELAGEGVEQILETFPGLH